MFNDKGKKIQAKHLYLKLNELVMGTQTHLFSQDKVAKFDPWTNSFKFPRFEFTSDLSKSKMPVPMKTFVIEIFEIDQKS